MRLNDNPPAAMPLVIVSCMTEPSRPREDEGAISTVYTVIAERNSPSPTPAIHLPTNSWGNEPAEQAIAPPAANTIAPSDIVRVLEILLDRGPAKREDIEAVKRIEETIRPWIVGSIELFLKKWCWNWDMTVMGPILPVSKPKQNPPIAVNIVHQI